MASRAVSIRTGVSSPAARSRRHTANPVDVGQLEVEHDGVGRVLGQRFEGLTTRGDGVHLVALQPQGPVDGAEHRRVIVHDQDAHDRRSYFGRLREGWRPIDLTSVFAPQPAEAGGVVHISTFRGSSIGRTSAFGAGCWRFEPSPRSHGGAVVSATAWVCRGQPTRPGRCCRQPTRHRLRLGCRRLASCVPPAPGDDWWLQHLPGKLAAAVTISPASDIRLQGRSADWAFTPKVTPPASAGC